MPLSENEGKYPQVADETALPSLKRSCLPISGVSSRLSTSCAISLIPIYGRQCNSSSTPIILGQINENVVAPRLIGGMTGVNPAVVLISVLLGAKVAGFLGLLLAVPTASFIKRIGDMVHSADDYHDLLPVQGEEEGLVQSQPNTQW